MILPLSAAHESTENNRVARLFETCSPWKFDLSFLQPLKIHDSRFQWKRRTQGIQFICFQRTRNTLERGMEKTRASQWLMKKLFHFFSWSKCLIHHEYLAPISLMIPSSTEIISLPRPRKPATTHKSSKKEVTDDGYCAWLRLILGVELLDFFGQYIEVWDEKVGRNSTVILIGIIRGRMFGTNYR